MSFNVVYYCTQKVTCKTRRFVELSTGGILANALQAAINKSHYHIRSWQEWNMDYLEIYHQRHGSWQQRN